MISLYGLFILLLTAEAIHAQVLTWFMFDPLLWVLPHFATHYAGQTTQGNTNEDDSVDQVSGSKDAPLHREFQPYYRLKTLHTKVHTFSNGVMHPRVLKPQKKCKGGILATKPIQAMAHSSNHHQNRSHPFRMILSQFGEMSLPCLF
ncbi:hypothetical protein BASA60_005459 [Batrachochytrium salamandrivorans]|nr:hypothetical protein BASA60_005459 [Batrachochytrium salamandrivorans]